MKPPTIESKIGTIIQKALLLSEKSWLKSLQKGGLYQVELSVISKLSQVYDKIMEHLLKKASTELNDVLKGKAYEEGHRNIEVRPISLYLVTGHEVKLMSPYSKKPPKSYTHPRHLLIRHWSIIGTSSPLLYRQVVHSSMICPSYETANELLLSFGVKICTSTVRAITNRVADYCYKQGEDNLQLKAGEHVIDQRVIISLDGGRTRTRKYKDSYNKYGNREYKTPWKEPKLFVIDTLNDQGNLDAEGLAIYGCKFSEAAILKSLKECLTKLQIQKAKEVQITGDGAPWIWKHLKPMLLELGVVESKITETLDYYHASSYVCQLVEMMPKRISKKKKKYYLSIFKEYLWTGQSDKIVEECKQVFKKTNDIINRYMNYLSKHVNKTQYADYERHKLMKGSGIVESGIRRIINLRFKAPASFWTKETVEKLYFLRAAILSYRWNIVMDNLTKIN